MVGMKSEIQISISNEEMEILNKINRVYKDITNKKGKNIGIAKIYKTEKIENGKDSVRISLILSQEDMEILKTVGKISLPFVSISVSEKPINNTIVVKKKTK